eukprot:scaffold2254_cov393-Prasinococcus_capsulatus_cf.AAC.1
MTGSLVVNHESIANAPGHRRRSACPLRYTAAPARLSDQHLLLTPRCSDDARPTESALRSVQEAPAEKSAQ